jgi:hypothetical protein
MQSQGCPGIILLRAVDSLRRGTDRNEPATGRYRIGRGCNPRADAAHHRIMPNRANLLPASLAALAAASLAACSSTTTARTAAAPHTPDPAVTSARAALAAASASCASSGGTWNGAGCVTPAAAVTTPTPATPTKVEFVVSGTAPDGINITYGPSGSNYAGPSTLNGTATMSVPFDGQASFYHLQAQL